MNRAQTFRKLVVLSTAVSLALSILGTGSAIAADSRILYVGSLLNASGVVIDTNTDGIPDNDKKLLPTAVTKGGSTKTDITVLSGDNQSIAHVVLFFPISPGTLPTGLTVSYVFGPDAGFCSPTGSVTTATSVRCDFGSLAAGGRRTVSILVDVAADFNPIVTTPPTPLLSANVETNNENGQNSQVFQANSGVFAVQAAGSDVLGTYAKPGLGNPQPFGTTGTQGPANKLTTSVTFKTNAANGNLVQIAEESGIAVDYLCPSGLTCQPDATTVDIDDGNGNYSTSPYLSWTLTALVPKTFSLSKAFVAHYPTGATASDWQLFWNTRSDKCSGATPGPKGHCLLSATLSKPDKATGLATLVITVLSDHNGGMRF